MFGQRVVSVVANILYYCNNVNQISDMPCTEYLTAKFRTLPYDHEGMLSMCCTAANAEKTEKGNNPPQITPYVCQLHSSQGKLPDSPGCKAALRVRIFQISETTHTLNKQVLSVSLQRTRTTLQGVRATHAAELKKREKDTDRRREK